MAYAKDERIPPVIPDLLPEEIPLPPKPDSTLKPPIHIYKTQDGQKYSIQVEYSEDEQYQRYKYFLTKKDETYLGSVDVCKTGGFLIEVIYLRPSNEHSKSDYQRSRVGTDLS